MNYDLLGEHHSVPCASDCTNDECKCVCHNRGGTMIKYPVKVVSRNYPIGDADGNIEGFSTRFLLEDSSGIELDINDSAIANTIANAINAMNEFPDIVGSEDEEVWNWYSKYIRKGAVYEY